MRIVFLATAKRDLRWFKRYYTMTFPEGRGNADRHFKMTLLTLQANPGVGHPTDAYPDAREFTIPRTPFAVIYRIKADRIEVLRLRDGRGER